jgi:hypothetical protein
MNFGAAQQRRVDAGDVFQQQGQRQADKMARDRQVGQAAATVPRRYRSGRWR